MAERDQAIFERETALIEIERLLPDFAQTCRESADVLLTHQDSFVADYQDEEYARGKAIKFAGLHGKEVRIIGSNREIVGAKAARVQ